MIGAATTTSAAGIMVYVPYFAAAGRYDQPFVQTKITRQRANVLAPWTTSTSTSTANMRMGWGKKGVTKGKPVYHSWGRWMPCKPYYRSGAMLRLTGNRDISTNQATMELSTRVLENFGRPGSRPSNPGLDLSYGGSLVDGSGCPALSANTRNRLVTECIIKIGDRKANYGEAIGESRQTLNHLANSVTRLAKALLALRKGNLPGMMRALGLSAKGIKSGKAPASIWLEAMYGWMPLVNDIYDTCDVLRNGIKRKAHILSGVRQLSEAAPINISSIYADMLGTASVRHRCKLFFRMTDSYADALHTLGLINPAEVAWALVPYSFVVDWVLPVGNVLEAFSAMQGLTYIDGCISSFIEIEAKGKHIRPDQASYTLQPESNFFWELGQFGFRRVVVTTPTPGLYVKSPFSTSHVLSAIALLRQLRK